MVAKILAKVFVSMQSALTQITIGAGLQSNLWRRGNSGREDLQPLIKAP